LFHFIEYVTDFLRLKTLAQSPDCWLDPECRVVMRRFRHLLLSANVDAYGRKMLVLPIRELMESVIWKV